MNAPTKTDFRDLAKQGNLIPVTRRLLADCETPVSVYQKIRNQGESFLFESVEGGEHLGRFSFVGCKARGVIRQWQDRVEHIERGQVVQTWTIRNDATNEDPAIVRDGLEVVDRLLKRYNPVNLPGLPRFTGGAVGFIGYEFIHDVEPVVPKPVEDELKTPTLYFLIADQLLVFDRVAQTITVVVNAFVESPDRADAAYEAAVSEIEHWVGLLEKPSVNPPMTLPDSIPDLQFESNMEKQRFLDNVQKAKEYILSGDIIQVVGSQRFSTGVKASPLSVYRAARSINPSPYMFLLELEAYSLVGASPEILVRCEQGLVEIRPIAGTRPRGKSEKEDQDLENELLADPKERAEHVMLIDLARNDIGRVCDYGSVQVKDLMVIERYSHVMHIVSQVEGRLSSDKSAFDLVRATFPAGTLTGAPKIRAMQIIAELEKTQRGPYGGCVGYFSFGGNLDCCITIRTALLKEGRAYVQAGGGWVHDSTLEGEYQETLNKAKAMIKAIAMAERFDESHQSDRHNH